MYLKKMTQRSIHRASTVITDSHAIAIELKQAYPQAENIQAIHLGVDTTHYTPQTDNWDEHILQHHQITKSYFLFVGTIEPRKNLETVLKAFQKAKSKGLNHQLVITGRYGWMIDKTLLQQEGVNWLGHVDENDLPALYRHADAVIAPSQYEGFDLPTIEALSCGTKVIASDIAVHREILGNDTIYVETNNVEAWTQAMLQSDGNSDNKQFTRSWEDVTKDTMSIYHQAKTKKG
jgi:glycosyltransferase involved in cell wall biosynthesis